MRGDATAEMPGASATDDEQQHGSAVLLVDECERGAGADRVPGDASNSSISGVSLLSETAPAFVNERALASRLHRGAGEPPIQGERGE